MKHKRIVAAVVAGVMAASMLSFGASAIPFNLHQSQGAPSSSNVIYQKLEFDSAQANYVDGYCNYFSLTSGNVKAKLYKKSGTTYSYKESTQISGTGECDIYHTSIAYGSQCRVTLEFMNSNAYGQVTGTYC